MVSEGRYRHAHCSLDDTKKPRILLQCAARPVRIEREVSSGVLHLRCGSGWLRRRLLRRHLLRRGNCGWERRNGLRRARSVLDAIICVHGRNWCPGSRDHSGLRRPRRILNSYFFLHLLLLLYSLLHHLILNCRSLR